MLAAEKAASRAAAQAEKDSSRLHDAHVSAWCNSPGYSAWRWRTRYRDDPNFMVKERLRRQFRKQSEAVPGLAEVIRAAIKSGARDSATMHRVLGYSLSDLRRHLERQFIDNMSWASWSREGWHIDHILPRKYFDLTTIEGVRAYWALPNLRPLWAKANLEKSDKREYLI